MYFIDMLSCLQRFSYERGGDARQKFWIKPLKETNLGVAQPLKAISLNFDHMTRVNKTNWKYTIY